MDLYLNCIISHSKCVHCHRSRTHAVPNNDIFSITIKYSMSYSMYETVATVKISKDHESLTKTLKKEKGCGAQENAA